MTKQKMVSQPISQVANSKLVEISKKRKAEGNLIKSKQDILAEAINAIYKREVK